MMKKTGFKKVIAINISFVFMYGVITGAVFTIILYAISSSGVFENFYQAVKFGLITGVFFGCILAVILGITLMPYRSVISFKDRDYFFSRMDIVLSRINYRMYERKGDLYIFNEKRGRYADISLLIEGSRAVIYGHYSLVRKIKRFIFK